MISATLVKELREKTGAGMMDCKKALQECNGDISAAADWLREKGIAKAAKKAERIAAEGLCEVAIEGNTAYVFELNAETDFVAKNEKFLHILEQIATICKTNHCKTVEEVLASKLDGQSGEEIIVSATATIGEKISLRRLTVVEKAEDEVFGVYKHNAGKIAVVSVIKGSDSLTAKDICMHVAMYNPRYLDETQVDPEVIEHERKVLVAEAKEQNPEKPENILEKMVEGRIRKFKKEICLVDQAFVKDPSQSVAAYLASKNAKAVAYLRYEVGEGMEKRSNDFAAEVAATAAAAAKH